ncbi:carboxypeptidase regulatory-like domain-containing protein [Hyphomonas sp. FCG-A18]|uniref:TonB-dependent receptor n=1 Tax=Hyphomonas sp. FCG-A18 TaxID=3080019 RepID=UPI002B2ACFE5|nr:carboxypeptidase regulatory-like domain-containing protein [Hyphomonas sp. FCG-A18]
MSNWKLYAGVAAATMATAAIIAPAQAQSTSSNINGQVTTEAGTPVAGASVTIIHLPSGSAATATTSENGVFFASGLRIGGPYQVTVQSSEGSVIREGINLKPSSNSLQFAVTDAEARQDVIVVTAEVGSRLQLNNGVGSVFSSSDIQDQPTVDRDLIATLTRDPLAFGNDGSLSVAGANPRFNALSIDGSLQQDDFGLSDQSYPTQRSPINLDAIEAVSLAATDYSVTTSGFTGGLINVVTKAGTNEFDGSAFYYRRDEDFEGNALFDTFRDPAPFTDEEYGFTLRGPIIEDKLFFAISYDEIKSAEGVTFVEDDADDGIDPTAFDALNALVLDRYGIDMGGRPQTLSAPFTSEKLLARIDWNINDDHRATFTYQDTQETNLASISSSEFASAWYDAPQELKAYGAQLNSQWTDQLSTELRFNFKDNTRGQICGNPDSGEIEIRLAASDAANEFLADGVTPNPLFGLISNNVTLTGSCDRFRHANEFNDERLQLFGAANYIWGDHLITVGADYEDYSLRNVFVPRANGEFIFNNLQDLVDGVADVRYDNVNTNNASDAAAEWSYGKLSLFAQDSWQIRPDFRLDYGFRYELFDQSDSPAFVQSIQDNFGVRSDENLDGLDVFLPRVGFEYTPFERTSITGGIGKYAGGSPQVWISNAFQTPIVFSNIRGQTNVDPLTVPQVNLDAVAGGTPVIVDVISSDFEIPSEWKASLKLDQEFDADLNRFGIPVNFGDDYLFSVQYIRTETDKGFRWENIAQTQLSEGVAPDGRPIYADLEDLDEQNLTALTNFDEGSSDIWTVALQNEFDNGFGFYASYANQSIEGVTPGTSSRGISNWRANVTFDRNNPEVGRANFEVEHAFKAFFSYETEIFKDLESKFNLFGTFTSGTPFSYTYDVSTRDPSVLFGRAGLGEGPFDNDLLYVPTLAADGSSADAAVVFGSGFDAQGFAELVNSRGLTQGQIASRNSDESPWNQQWDFQWSQELPFFNDYASKYVGENKLRFVLDIENVANLLNDEWGTQYEEPSFGAIGLVDADLVSAADVAANGIDGATALRGDEPRTVCTTSSSCVYRYTRFNDFRADTGNRDFDTSFYTIRVGLRYEF